MKKLIQVVAVLLVLVASFSVGRRLAAHVVVDGDSMAPTLKNGQHFLLNKVRSPRLHDVVVFTDPVTHTYSVKRIMATAGDTISFKAGWVYINGEKLAEPYLPSHTLTVAATNTYTVEVGRVYLLGDNRGESADSREYGTVSLKDIEGVVTP